MKDRTAASESKAGDQQKSSSFNIFPPVTATRGLLDGLNRKPLHGGPALYGGPGLLQRQSTVTSKSVRPVLSAPVGLMRSPASTLTINEPGDPFEEEADQVSEQVMRTPNPAVVRRRCVACEHLQRKCASCEEAEELDKLRLNRQDEIGEISDPTNITSPLVHEVLNSPGQPLDADTRAFMELRFGLDLSKVRVHADERASVSAESVSARAYTVGSHVVFGRGQYAPDTITGKRLLAHELTHVVQQGGQPQFVPGANAPLNRIETGKEQVVGGIDPSPRRANELPGERIALVADAISDAPITAQDSPSSDHAPSSGAEGAHPAEANTLDEPNAPELSLEASAGDNSFGPQSKTDSGEVNSDFPNVVKGNLHSEKADEFDLHGIGNVAAQSQVFLQRAENDSSKSGGLLDRIRHLLGSAMDQLRAGWNSLTQKAQAVFTGLEDRGANFKESVGRAATSVTASVQRGWEGLGRVAANLSRALDTRLKAGVAPVADAFQSVSSALTNVNPEALQISWDRLQSSIQFLWAGIRDLAQTSLAGLLQSWNALRKNIASAGSTLANTANAALEGLRKAVQAAGDTLQNAWAGLKQRAADASGVVGTAAAWMVSLLSSLIFSVRRLWENIQGLWANLQQRFVGIYQRLQTNIAALWQSIKTKTGSFFDSVITRGVQLRQSMSKQVDRILSGVKEAGRRIGAFAIGGVIKSLLPASRWLMGIRKALANPEAMTNPIVATISTRIEAGMPLKAEEIGDQKIKETGRGMPVPLRDSGNAVSTLETWKPEFGSPLSSRDVASSEEERSTTSRSAIWEGFKHHLIEKWNQIKVWDMVKQALWSLIWPWPTVGKEYEGMEDDLKTAAKSIFRPRALSRPLETLHDLWSDALHIVDFPVIIWRRLNNILGALSGWLTIALIVGGAIVGSILPGAGTAAGAGVGLELSLSIGEGLLISFIAAESTNLLKAVLDLTSARQTSEEKEVSFGRMADSTIALGVAAVIAILANIAARIVGAILSFVRRIAPRISGRVPEAVPPELASPEGTSVPKKEIPDVEPAREAIPKEPETEPSVEKPSSKDVETEFARRRARASSKKQTGKRAISEKRKPSSERLEKIRASYIGKKIAVSIPEELRLKFDKLLKARETARRLRDQMLEQKDRGNLTADRGVNLSEARGAINEASRQIGDLAADEYMKETYINQGIKADKIYPPEGSLSRSGDFDQIWRITNKGGEASYVVIESKGGVNPQLGTRIVDGARAEQGTAEYLKDIIDNMSRPGQSGETVAVELAAAGSDAVKYVKIEALIARNGSAVRGINARQFDIQPKK